MWACSGSRSRCKGYPVHVREMGAGANAIDAAYRVVAELRRMEAEWNARKAGRAHFENEAHPINLNVGKIEGGDWASSVPCWCASIAASRSIRVPRPTRQREEIRDRVAAFARSDAYFANNPPAVTFNGFFAEGYVLPARIGGRSGARTGARGSDRQAASNLHDGELSRCARLRALRPDTSLCYGPSRKISMAVTSAPASRRSSASRPRWRCSSQNGAVWKAYKSRGGRSRIHRRKA